MNISKITVICDTPVVLGEKLFKKGDEIPGPNGISREQIALWTRGKQVKVEEAKQKTEQKTDAAKKK